MHNRLLPWMALSLASTLISPVSAGIFSKYANPDLAVRTFSIATELKEKEQSSSKNPQKTGADALPMAYNAPAQIEVAPAQDWYLSASYLYWNALQEGMTLGWELPGTATSSTPPLTGVERLEFDFNYESGFKVGLGTNFKKHDHWSLNFEFTRLAFTETTNKTAPLDKVYGRMEWLSSSNQPSFMEKVEAKWHLNLNLLDGYVARAFYNGSKLILTPYMGIRAGWIRQSYDIYYTAVTEKQIESTNKSSCWAIGARGGLNGSWLLGMGFRVQGNAAGSILYSHYNINHSESNATDTTPGASWFAGKDSQEQGRVIAELGLGVGWGRYLNKNRQHIDLSANYDFAYLPGQNVLRSVEQDYQNYSNTGGTALTLSGLTVRATFDF